MASAAVLNNTYFDLLPNEVFYHVLELANRAPGAFRKCVNCKWYVANALSFYVPADCGCCSGEAIYLCRSCLPHKYKYVNETRKHVRTVAWRNKSRERRYQKRVAKTRSRDKSKASTEFVEFADLFS